MKLSLEESPDTEAGLCLPSVWSLVGSYIGLFRGEISQLASQHHNTTASQHHSKAQLGMDKPESCTRAFLRRVSCAPSSHLPGT